MSNPEGKSQALRLSAVESSVLHLRFVVENSLSNALFVDGNKMGELVRHRFGKNVKKKDAGRVIFFSV